MKRYYITDIDWEVDEVEDLDLLPTEVTLKVQDTFDEDFIADALSDEYGFLVRSFSLKEKD